MKKRLGIALALIFALTCMMVPAMAAAPETTPVADGIVMEDLAETQFTVVSVGLVEDTDTRSMQMMDGQSGATQTTREAVLADKNGQKRTITLGKSVKNFDQIKVGDTVTITTYLQTAIFVGKIGEVPGVGESKLIFSAPKGEKPAAIEVEKTFVTLKINKLDPEKKTIAVILPDNSKKTISTPNVNFAKLKVGDDVIVSIKKETNIIVAAPGK